ncbi:MAG: hypothetical protein ACOVO2_08410, partial [Emticicia sp.]|uniref:Ig-like domain-containing protein n=1 Tax=Emticicia sp. TaxID=1930953 RepID=UPI003BA46E49
MKKSIILFITLIVCSIYTFAQQQNNSDRGIYESYVILSKNGGSPTYYDLQTDQAANPNFGGSLGVFGVGCSLVINGGQNNTYKCNGCNILNGSFNYAIYPSGGSATSFSSFVLGFASNDAGGCGGNQTWRNNSQNINVLNGLTPGTYVIEIYTQNPFDGCGSGIMFSSNNGSNYRATFTVIAPPTLPTSASVCLGSSVSLTGSCTNGTPKWSTGEEANTISVSPTTTTTYTATCKTAEGCESATSSSVTVTVNSVSIVAHPVTQFDCEPNSIRFLANASTTSLGAGSTIIYQWERRLPSETNFSTLTNSATPIVFSGNTLQISPTGSPNVTGTQVRYKATDGNGCSATSNPATLYLNNVGTISNTAICENTNYSLIVPVASDVLANVASYQWEVLDASTNTWGNVSNGGGISGATAQTLNFTAIPFSQDGKKYRCRVIFNVSANNDNDGSINQGPATTCPRTSAEVTLNVKPIPTVPAIVTASPQNLCLGASVTLNSTGCSAQGGTTSWYESGVVVSTNAIYTFTPSAVGSKTYRATCTKSACESAFSTDLVVNVNPVPVAPPVSINPASAVVCQGATVVLTATRETASNTLRWYRQALGGSSVSIATNRTVPVGEVIPTDPNTPGIVSYWTEQENTFGCKSLRTQTDFTVNPTPSAPTVTTPINYCQNAPTSNLSATATGSNALLWYGTSSTGGVSSASAPLPTSTSLGTTTYYVSQRNSYACESARAAINVIVNAIPPVPTTTTTISYCKNSPSTSLIASATGSNSLVWYDENDVILATAPTPNTATVGTQIFKVSQKSPSPANCESPKVTITVTINDLPLAPTVSTPVNYCQNATPVALSAVATGSNTLLWYGTNATGGSSSATATIPATNTAGTTSYYVSQRDVNNCESPRAKIDVEVTANTTVAIAGTNAFCMIGVLNSATTLTANPAGGNGTYTYQWQNLGGVIASATNQTYEVNNTVQSGSSDTYKVTVNSGNCTATANITVSKQGWADVPSVSGNTPDICGSGSKTLSVVSPFGTNYKWYSEATSLSPIITGTSFITPTLTTTTTYYVAREQQITANLTCQTVRTAVTINVSVIPETPVIVNSANKTTFCNNESGFSLSTTCTAGNPQYRLNNGSWTNGGSLTITPSNYTNATTLTYEFKCVSNTNCESSTTSATLQINPVPSPPTVTGNTIICEGNATNLIASGCTGTTVWSNGSTGAILMVSVSGTYTAICRVNGCESSASLAQTIVVNPRPIAPIISSDDADNTVCVGTIVKLTADGCTGSVIWSNGIIGSTIPVASSGTYAAFCRLESCDGPLSSVQTIVVNPLTAPPSITSDDADNTVCEGTSINLTANGCTGSVIWSNGATTSTITVSNSGTYNARCTLNGCTSAVSTTQNIIVNPNPTITVTPLNSICSNTTFVNLQYTITTNDPNRYSLTSTMPDFIPVSDALLPVSPINIIIPSGKTGNHTFTLNVKNSTTNCASSQTFSITVLPALIGGSIETSSSTVNCSGYNAGVISNVSAASGGKTAYVYQWQSSTDNQNFTDIAGENLTTYNPPAITQTTFYRRKVTDACGVVAYSSNVHQIQIVPDPQITITDVADRIICSGGVLNLEAAVIGGSGTCTATWESATTLSGTYSVEQTGGLSFSKMLTNASSSPSVRYYRVNYSCTGTGSSACNQSVSSPVKVTVNYIPAAPTVSGNSSICEGSSTTLTASGCAGTVTWSNATTGSTLIVSTAGTYSATCTENSCTSLSSNIHSITVNPIPNAPTVISDDADNIVCAGTSIQLSVSDCAGTVVWSNNASATSISVSASGTYNAICVVKGCSSVPSTKQTVVVNAIPSAPIISGNTSICAGNSTTLTASGCSGIVVWNTGVTNSALSVSTAGTYNATCTVNDCVSPVSQTTTISVNSVPIAPTISGNTSFCVGSSTTLTANGCAGVITWNTGVTGSTLNVSSAGTYSATCTENSCTSLASLVQTISSNPLPTISLGTVSSLCNIATTFELPFTSPTNNPDKYSLTSTMPDFVAVAETNLPLSPISVIIPAGKTGNQNFTLNIKNSSTGCVGTQTFSINILPALNGGSIETSSSTINCSGYNAGAISSVSLASGGKLDYVYQWQSSTDGTNFTDIVGANSTTYDPPALTQTTYYRRKVTDACGAEAFSSNVHQIQIVPDPQITVVDASDRTICSGGNISIEATVIGGSGTCTPTWQSSTTPSGTYTNEQVGGLNFTTTLTNSTTAAITRYYRA